MTNNLSQWAGRNILITPLNCGFATASPLARLGFFSLVNTVQTTTGIYSKFRIHSWRIRFDLINNESHAIVVTVVPISAYLVNTFATNNYGADLRLAQRARTKIINGLSHYQDKITINHGTTINSLNPGEDTTTVAWQGNYNTNPSSTCSVYLQASAVDPANLFTVAGLDVTYTIELMIEGLHPNITLTG